MFKKMERTMINNSKKFVIYSGPSENSNSDFELADDVEIYKGPPQFLQKLVQEA